MNKLISVIIILAASTVNAKEAEKNNLIKVPIRPECKSIFYPPDMDGKSRKWPDYALWDPSAAKPSAFKDPRTQNTFYVESDGRHLAAINSKGKLLWVRNPFEESEVQCEYRSPHPVITEIKIFENPESLKFSEDGPKLNLKHKFIMIYFDSSQFGIVDQENGDYVWLGQN
ncbi:MAG: hypothetical protein B0W54_01400 [Cellvibrio sp. 79]|nr:MAG: hypothetical protein B0W54_01400 [Cellvibrio sp. 79]